MAFSSLSARVSALLAVPVTKPTVAFRLGYVTKKCNLIAPWDVSFAFQVCVLEPRVPNHQ